LGVLDVLDLMTACGGKDGWTSVFSKAIEMDDFSDSGSVLSRGSGLYSAKHSVTGHASIKGAKEDHPISKLRPKKPLVATSDFMVLEVVQLIASKRGDAALIVDGQGALSGIFSDTDLVRRVVAKYLDPSNTNIMAVATRDPQVVSTHDSALDALSVMIENRFR
jgi:CBS domain containing-hemolysin-like protein